MKITITNKSGLRVSLDTDTGEWSAPAGDGKSGIVAAALSSAGLPDDGPHDTPVTLALSAVRAFGYTDLSATVEVSAPDDTDEDDLAGEDAITITEEDA